MRHACARILPGRAEPAQEPVAPLSHTLLDAAEWTLARVPRRPCTGAERARLRVISHRGEHGTPGVAENTLAAFEPLRDQGVWGLECDVRWTRDGEPVLLHDPDTRRVFGAPLVVADTDFARLRRACPGVTHLDELVQQFAGHLHLMIELKTAPRPGIDRPLADCLAGLAPARDFHLLSLDMSLFDQAGTVPPQAWLPVARTNVATVSRFALARGCAGMAGPFALIGRRRLARHHAGGQQVGVGFPRRTGLVSREAMRGVDWLFTNHALAVAAMLRPV